MEALGEQSLQHAFHGGFGGGPVGFGGDVQSVGVEPAGAVDLAVLDAVSPLDATVDCDVAHAEHVARDLGGAVVLKLHISRTGVDGCDSEGGLLGQYGGGVEGE